MRHVSNNAWTLTFTMTCQWRTFSNCTWDQISKVTYKCTYLFLFCFVLFFLKIGHSKKTMKPPSNHTKIKLSLVTLHMFKLVSTTHHKMANVCVRVSGACNCCALQKNCCIVKSMISGLAENCKNYNYLYESKCHYMHQLHEQTLAHVWWLEWRIFSKWLYIKWVST